MPTKQENETNKIICRTEYDRLFQVIVCSPKYMKIDKVINSVQAYYKEENINWKKAVEQHETFIHVLQKHGVEVLRLEPEQNLNEQVFTRDIGFCITDQCFIAQMDKDIRKGETKILEQKLEQNNIFYFSPFKHSIEGGDVLIDEGKIWIGLSQRTTEGSLKWLERRFPDHQVIPLPIDDKILHLDCAFNILSPDTAIVYPGAFTEKIYQIIKAHYSVIEVSASEQFFMGTNVLSIGDRKVLSLPQNEQVNEEMTKRGFHVIEVDFSEIIKSGGSFRCCSLPLYRA